MKLIYTWLLIAIAWQTGASTHMSGVKASKVGRRELWWLRRHKKSSKSSKSTPAPTTSVMPSSKPSPSPSFMPSVSMRPSSKPSSSPSGQPTSRPSSQPSEKPSISVRPSSKPSPSPSSKPSSSPSSSPTFSPSASPSNFPSKTPSVAPTSFPSHVPSMIPSVSPTLSPSEIPSASSIPSTSPSSSPSSSPTINTVSGQKIVENGIQDGCPVPLSVDPSIFAEETVTRVSVEFVYMMKFKNALSEDDAVDAIESDMLNFIMENYVDCENIASSEINIRSRMLQETETNRPIGSSTLPVDTSAEDFVCTDDKKGESCIPMDGYLELIFTSNAEINPYDEENAVLVVIKDAIDNGSLEFSNPNILEATYLGKRNGPSFAITNSNIITRAEYEQNQRLGNGRGVSETGAVMISGAVGVVLLLLFAGKRRLDSKELVENHGLTSLRGVSKRDYDLFEINNSDGHNTIDYSTPQSTPDRAFPISPRGSDLVTKTERKDLACFIQDVHKCKSALCQRCNGGTASNQNTRFIRTTEWYDGFEVDFSDTSTYWKGEDLQERNYVASSTVDL